MPRPPTECAIRLRGLQTAAQIQPSVPRTSTNSKMARFTSLKAPSPQNKPRWETVAIACA
eukprot:9515125-Alexandrium_andersonii.AAC.1